MDVFRQGNWSQALAALINATWNAAASSLTINIRRFAIQVLRRGPIPQHVAFIMDGNRRWAKNWAVQQGLGHIMGFRTLEHTLDWCHDLGIKCVSVYAFSIENFKRPVEEVDVLMDLARKKFEEFCMEGYASVCEANSASELIQRNQIQVRVVGDLSLAPQDVQDAAKRAMDMTRDNHKSILNICFPYTSRNEITQAVQHMKSERDDEFTMEQHLFTALCPTLDMLVRTSGEVRLSDYLLWQTSSKPKESCSVQFIDVLWPDFSFWDFVPLLLDWQRSHQ